MKGPFWKVHGEGMRRLECPCGRILWDDQRGCCPSCGRSRETFKPTSKEYGSDREEPREEQEEKDE